MTDPLQLRRFAFARLSALRATFRFDPTSPYFLSPDGTTLLIKIAGWHSVHDMAGAKATVAVIQQASDALRAQPAFRGLTVQATGGYSLRRRERARHPSRYPWSACTSRSSASAPSWCGRCGAGRAGRWFLTYGPWSRPRAWHLCGATLDAQRPDPRLHREPDRFLVDYAVHPATGLQRA